jgi:hypothetical protein
MSGDLEEAAATYAGRSALAASAMGGLPYGVEKTETNK